MDRLLRERSTVLGSSLVEQPVGRRPYDPDDNRIWEPHPRSENPPLEQLDVPVQREALSDAQIAGRLRAYADYASGTSLDPDGAEPAPAIPITIQDAFRTAQRSGREFLRNQEEYLLAAIRLLQERHLWGPRFFNTTAVGLSGEGDSGRFDHATRILNTLRATQRLPYGGTVEAQWIVQATNQLRDRATGSYTQSSRLVLGADIPLLRGAGQVAREDLIQAERNLVYQARTFERSRRELLVSIAEDYFGLLEQASVIRNQREQIRGLERLLESTAAKVEAGRLRPFQKDLSENQLLRAQATLANLRERYILQQDRFKIRLGLEVENPLDLGEFTLEIPTPAVSQTIAVERALQFRLDLQNRRDQLDDRRRAVRNAKNALLPTLDLSGLLNIPTPDDDPTGGLAIDPEELNYAVEMSLGLPLDREIERLTLRSRIIDLERAIRDYEQFRDNLIVDARSTVRGIDLAKFQLRLAEEQVRINERRLEDLNLRDDTDPQSIVDAERELNEARNSRDSAMTDLRTTILNYLLTTDQLRVDESGMFQPLPGWDAVPAGAG